jgi:hypothetical protein
MNIVRRFVQSILKDQIQEIPSLFNMEKEKGYNWISIVMHLEKILTIFPQ